jgi:hypothetical protein
MLPPVPLIVTEYVPGVVLFPTDRVTVELPDPGAGMGLGLKLADVPRGSPVAERLMLLLKPPLTEVATEACP